MVLANEVLRNVPTQRAPDRFKTLRHRAADKPVEHLFQRDGHSELTEHVREDAVGDQLTVDQNTIAIENHQGKSFTSHLATTTIFTSIADGLAAVLGLYR